MRTGACNDPAAGDGPGVPARSGSGAEAGAMVGEARFSEDLLMGEASLTLELKGSLATGTLELAAHRGPWTVHSEPVSDGPTLRIPGIGFAIAHGDWVFDKLVVTLPGGGGVIVLAGSH